MLGGRGLRFLRKRHFGSKAVVPRLWLAAGTLLLEEKQVVMEASHQALKRQTCTRASRPATGRPVPGQPAEGAVHRFSLSSL